MNELETMVAEGFPLPFVFGELSHDGVFKVLGLKKHHYYWTFRSLMLYWGERLPGHNKYLLLTARQLANILKTPDEWLEVGRYLADATKKTFGNGSHSFISQAVPSLIDGGLVHTKEEFVQGIDILLETINPLGHGEQYYEIVARRVLEGQIKSLDDLRTQRYTKRDINEHRRFLEESYEKARMLLNPV